MGSIPTDYAGLDVKAQEKMISKMIEAGDHALVLKTVQWALAHFEDKGIQNFKRQAHLGLLRNTKIWMPSSSSGTQPLLASKLGSHNVTHWLIRLTVDADHLPGHPSRESKRRRQIGTKEIRRCPLLHRPLVGCHWGLVDAPYHSRVPAWCSQIR